MFFSKMFGCIPCLSSKTILLSEFLIYITLFMYCLSPQIKMNLCDHRTSQSYSLIFVITDLLSPTQCYIHYSERSSWQKLANKFKINNNQLLENKMRLIFYCGFKKFSKTLSCDTSTIKNNLIVSQVKRLRLVWRIYKKGFVEGVSVCGFK